MKIVITGALGHIGSALIRSLPDDFPNVELVLVDNLKTQRFCSLFDLPDTARYRFHEADVTEVDLRPILEGAYAVVHLAAMTEAAGSFGRAEEVEANNFQATLKVVNACVATGVRLIAPSSASVYGTEKSEVSEDGPSSDLNPQSPYAAVKLQEEQLIQDAIRTEGLKAVSCRLGTIFGVSRGMRFHTAVNKFCWQAIMGTPLTVWKTALDQRRPYLDLADACRSIGFILDQDLFDGRVFNILTLNATVRDIIGIIREHVPTVEINLVDSPVMNQLSYDVSTTRIRNAGFQFSGDLHRGIAQTMALLSGITNATIADGGPSEISV